MVYVYPANDPPKDRRCNTCLKYIKRIEELEKELEDIEKARAITVDVPDSWVMCDLETEQEIKEFEEQIKNVKYNPLLADFFSKYINDIEDLT